MNSNCDLLVEALYQIFTTPLLFPSAEQARYYDSLCRLGYAEVATQGHARNGAAVCPSGRGSFGRTC